MSNWLRAPFIKPKGFICDPIARYGIPREADSRLNKKVRGTLAWEQFWEEQLYYIINGYETGGMWIPGRYYYYLNFHTFNTVMGPIRPQMCDLHLELAYLIDYCKLNGRNFIGPKGRRVGISEASHTMIVDYGYRFTYGYKAGICAGNKIYVDDFMKKWDDSNAIIVPEFKTKTLINNTKEVIAGYEFKDDYGNVIEDGTQNIIYKRTMFNDPNLFKGLPLNDVIAEEMGEFDHAKEFYDATLDCIMFGEQQRGNIWMYGTGGNMKGSSAAFSDIWHNNEDYNAERFFISRAKFFFPYYGGAKNEFGAVVEKIPNLKHLEPYQRLGMIDEVAAEEAIKVKREEILALGNLQKYYTYCQNTAITIKEVFVKTVSNHFNIKKLNEQAFDIESLPHKKYIKYKLDWKKNDNGYPIIPRQVFITPAKDTDLEEDCVLILADGHPLAGYRNLFVGGLDSYDQDQAKTSKSLGAMVVLRRANNMFMENKQVVCLIRTRPSRREKFYEMCAMVSVYYNLYSNTLIDVAKPAVMQHYKDLGLESYLAKRPMKFQSEKSEQSHEYGVAITGYSKPIMVGMLQSYVQDYYHTLWFGNVIEELGNYDEIQKDSDNDTVDALGIALMQDVSEGVAPFNQDDESLKEAYSSVEYMMDEEGNTVIKNKDSVIEAHYEGGVKITGNNNPFDNAANF